MLKNFLKINVLFLLFLIYSCSVTKKFTETETKKTLVFDTIIKINVVNDTVKHTAFIYDTLNIETKYFHVKIFNDTIHKKIVALENEKDFKVNVKATQTTETKTETKEIKKPSFFVRYAIYELIIIMFLLYIGYDLFIRKNKIK